MPIYEYRCQTCGHELEQLQRLSDPALKDCPACGKPKLQRLISAAGFRLKGAGWYETDFKQGNKRNLVDGSGSAPQGAAGAETRPGGADSSSKADAPAGGDGGTKKAAGKDAGKDKSSSSSGKTSGSSAAGSV